MKRLKLQNTPTVRRMPTYLHKLLEMQNRGEKFVSTTYLAGYMNLEPIVVKKDIARTGITGIRRIGYRIDELIEHINRYLGWEELITAALIGAGSLGTAILGFNDLREDDLAITSVFDSDPAKIGREVRGYRIFDAAEMEAVLRPQLPDLAILCVPSAAAQETADRLIACGIRCFWNFANVCLRVPDDVIVQREVIAGGFAVLSYKMKYARSGGLAPVEH